MASSGPGSFPVVVPLTAVTGNVSVTANNVVSAGTFAFTVNNPRPSGLTPNSAIQGTTVTVDLTGVNGKQERLDLRSKGDGNSTAELKSAEGKVESVLPLNPVPYYSLIRGAVTSTPTGTMPVGRSHWCKTRWRPARRWRTC